MPRIIPDTTRALLTDRDWLIDQHVNQLMSISELAKQLHVTENVIRKALRSFSIVSPSQQALREASNMRKYGVKNTGMLVENREKAAKTMNERFNGHNWRRGSSSRTKALTTKAELYGDECVSKTEYSKQKTAQTNWQKYGRSHANQRHLDDSVFDALQNYNWLFEQHISQRKSVLAIAETLGVDYNTVASALSKQNIEQVVRTTKLSPETYDKLTCVDWMTEQNVNQEKSCVAIAHELGVDPWTVARRFREAGMTIKTHPKSLGEKEVADFIKSLGISNVIGNDRSLIAPKELDIYLPDHKLAIEYCGLYWHSDAKKHYTYHQQKREQCDKLGIRLLTIYENEWTDRRDLVQSKIRNILGMSTASTVYARKCVVEPISKAAKQSFFDANHIQGDGPSSINYALKHGGQIVAVVGFIVKSNKTFVLNRYATSCNVPGGFSKLLKHFQQNNDWAVIETFADLRWSNGKLYYDNGFEMVKKLPADYAYIINGVPCHKFAFRRKYLQTFLENFDPAKSEWENMSDHGYDRVWDRGKLKFQLAASTLNS